MITKIGRVEFDLSYYGGNDQYSDGDIENEMLEVAKKCSEEEILQIVGQDRRWPILYHFSPQRRNLLEWFPFGKQSTVLEIGAGCGALTGALCDQAGKVTSVELSKRRAETAAYRHRDQGNLKIVVGNLNEIQFQDPFDFVTLIGVLEYAGKFTNTENPYRDFLKKIKSFMKPDGTLILAIENKFGLKYWAGANEDHTNVVFDGLENYRNNDGIATFGKKELETLLMESGLMPVNFYYPYPDYKLPSQIYSDHYLPSIGEFGDYAPNYDSDRYRLFNEKVVFDNVIANSQFPFFSNSFLVLCKGVE